MSNYFATFSNFIGYGQYVSVEVKVHVRSMITGRILGSFHQSTNFGKDEPLSGYSRTIAVVEGAEQLVKALRAELSVAASTEERVMDDSVASQWTRFVRSVNRRDLLLAIIDRLDLLLWQVNQGDGVHEMHSYLLEQLAGMNGEPVFSR